MRYPADKIFFKKFQRAITPKGEITRKRKKNTGIKNLGGGGGRVWGGGGLCGGQDRCERRIEVFVKIQKKKIVFFFFGGGGGVRMDVNEEMKFL